jgi:BirA family biotin operon repressor/biotin-[acetyl-CoA-carboxylase] ligase
MLRRIHYDVIDSTNTEARRLASAGLTEPLLVTASEQFAGRGRNGRTWHSPRGGAWMSLVWPTRRPAAESAAISLAAAAGVVRGLEDLAVMNADFRVKWPNDILIDDRKVAGILCEQRLGGGSNAEAIIIGVGVNVDFNLGELPADLRHPATTLAAVFGRPYSVEEVADSVGQRLVAAAEEFEQHGLTRELLSVIRQRLAYVGDLRRWTGTHGVVEGRVAGIDDAGRLLLDCASGRVACDTGELVLYETDRSRI